MIGATNMSTPTWLPSLVVKKTFSHVNLYFSLDIVYMFRYMDMAWFGVAGVGYTLLLGGAVVKPLP